MKSSKHVNKPLSPLLIKKQKNLLKAIKNGDIEEVKEIISKNPQISSEPFTEDSVDPESKGDKGDATKTPILIAAEHGQWDIITLLVEDGASFSGKQDRYNHTTLIMAAYGGQIETMKLLLAKGLSLKDRDNHGNTPLLAAAWNGHKDAVKFLLEKDEKQLSDRNKYQETPLLSAAYHGHLEVVKYLVKEKGASLEDKNNKGKNAMEVAGSEKHVKIEAWLNEWQGKIAGLNSPLGSQSSSPSISSSNRENQSVSASSSFSQINKGLRKNKVSLTGPEHMEIKQNVIEESKSYFDSTPKKLHKNKPKMVWKVKQHPPALSITAVSASPPKLNSQSISSLSFLSGSNSSSQSNSSVLSSSYSSEPARCLPGLGSGNSSSSV